MWELDHKGWAPKYWCFWTVVLENILESPLDSKEIKPVNPKGNKPWIVTGRIDAETEAPIFWPPDAQSRLSGKDSDTGRVWRQEEKEMTEDEMAGWHHWLNGHKFEQAPGVGDGQGSLACCEVHGVSKSRTRLRDWTEDIFLLFYSNLQTNPVILGCCGSWSGKTFLLLVTNWKSI